MKSHPLELELKKEGFFHVAGIDEAGRGPWAGPLVAAAVIIPHNTKIQGLNDSKKLTATQREILFKIILKKTQVGVGVIPHSTIDEFGLSQALAMAYQQAIDNITVKPDFTLIDGIGKYNLSTKYKTVKFGDSKVRSIAAASIIAKVVRDNIMLHYGKKYPKYMFSEHKGYGTRQHRQKLLQYGVCPIHRTSFKPIKELIYGQTKIQF